MTLYKAEIDFLKTEFPALRLKEVEPRLVMMESPLNYIIEIKRWMGHSMK